MNSTFLVFCVTSEVIVRCFSYCQGVNISQEDCITSIFTSGAKVSNFGHTLKTFKVSLRKLQQISTDGCIFTFVALLSSLCCCPR